MPPLTEKERDKSSHIVIMDDLAHDWFKECDVRLKNPQIPRQVYRGYIQPSLGKHAIADVSPLDIRPVLKKPVKKGVPTRANDALMYMKQLFSHAIKLGLIPNNPALAFRNFDAGGQEKSQSRALSLDEIQAALSVMKSNSNQFTRENYLSVLLLLSLGVRKAELIQAQWSEFNLDDGIWVLPEERSKTGVAISISSCPKVVIWTEELKVRANESEFVFPNRLASERFGYISPDTLNALLLTAVNNGGITNHPS